MKTIKNYLSPTFYESLETTVVPVVIFEYKLDWWFFVVDLHIEDRRPDLLDGEYCGKYKTFIEFKCFAYQLNIQFRSQYKPWVGENDGKNLLDYD